MGTLVGAFASWRVVAGLEGGTADAGLDGHRSRKAVHAPVGVPVEPSLPRRGNRSSDQRCWPIGAPGLA
jgi:hypothetical protein